MHIDPFGLFDPGTPQRPTNPPANSALIPSRNNAPPIRRLESYQTRTLILGLIRLFQRRGIIGQDELQYLLSNLIEAGEIKDDDGVG